MKKQYVLSEKEYKDLVPKSALKYLQDKIDCATAECIRLACENKNCIKKSGCRMYCKDYDWPEHDCQFLKMCDAKGKKYEDAPRKVDHMLR